MECGSRIPSGSGLKPSINRGQFQAQGQGLVFWVYGLFKNVPGDLCQEANEGVHGQGNHGRMAVSYRCTCGTDSGACRAQRGLCADHDALYHGILHAACKRGRSDVIPDGCVNFAFLGR